MSVVAPTFVADSTQVPPARRIGVLHLIHTVAYGGVETAVLNWIQNLDAERFDVRLACFANPGGTEEPFVQAAERRGLHVDKVTWNRSKPVWKASSEVVALIGKYHTEILHTHNCYADCVGALTARRTRVKTITTLYVWSPLGWKRNLIQEINGWMVRGYDVISAHCEDTYQKALAKGFPPEKVRLLTCGYEAEIVTLPAAERERRRRELGASPDDVVLLNIARLYPEKGQAFLLQVFRGLLQKFPAARLWIAGVGPLEQSLKSLCQELELDSRVNFLGFVEALPALLPLADICVSSSTTEGVPLAICSALSAGLPVVATAVGGLTEIIKNSKTGMLVPANDEAALVDALSVAISEPAYRQSLGAAASDFMRNEYSLSRAVRRVEDTYCQVVG
jgi:glycosyltransferase involved in cell wall biosynthesis